MARNPYAPPRARSLELPGPAPAWARVRLLVPSLGTASVVTVGLFVVAAMNSQEGSKVSLDLLAGLFVTYLFAVAVAFLIGLLFRYLAQHWNVGRSGVAVTIGAIVGSLSVVTIDFVSHSIPELSPVRVPLIAYVQFAVVGAAAGFVFWLIARRDARPNTSLERTRER